MAAMQASTTAALQRARQRGVQPMWTDGRHGGDQRCDLALAQVCNVVGRGILADNDLLAEIARRVAADGRNVAGDDLRPLERCWRARLAGETGLGKDTPIGFVVRHFQDAVGKLAERSLVGRRAG